MIKYRKNIDIDNVDIKSIDSNDVFALDTNILFWMHYSNATNPNLNNDSCKIKKYSNFIEKLLDNGNLLVTTVLNISELINIVEKNENKIYNVQNDKNVKIKQFRKIKEHRDKYKNEIESIMLQINNTYGEQIKVIDITNDDINKFVKNIDNNYCDIFDYVVINKLKGLGIVNFITDDNDFLTVNGINVYSTKKSNVKK